jgi:hypothetical protein
MKYSQNFEKAYNFYHSNMDEFTFCGASLSETTHTAIFSKDGVSAKEAFYSIESFGKNIPTYESELLNRLLMCKAGVNFNIKYWAEGVAEGLFTLNELTDGYQVWVKKAVEGMVIKNTKQVNN